MPVTRKSTGDFNPLLWFVCGLCRKAFPDTDRLKNHKKLKHWKECERIKCIVFEERILDRQWIPTDNIFPQSESPGLKTEGEIFPDEVYCHCNCTATVSFISRSDQVQDQDLHGDHPSFIQSPPSSRSRSLSSSQQSTRQSTPTKPKPNSNSNSNLNISLNSTPNRNLQANSKHILSSPNPNPKPNPFVSLKRLTEEEINSALNKLRCENPSFIKDEAQDLEQDHEAFNQSPRSRFESLSSPQRSARTKSNRKFNSDCDLSTSSNSTLSNNVQTKPKQNPSLKRSPMPDPFTLLKRLTEEEINSALNKLHTNSTSFNQDQASVNQCQIRNKGEGQDRSLRKRSQAAGTNSERTDADFDASKNTVEEIPHPIKRQRFSNAEDPSEVFPPKNKCNLDSNLDTLKEDIEIKSDIVETDALPERSSSPSIASKSSHSFELVPKNTVESDEDNDIDIDVLTDEHFDIESEAEIQSVSNSILSIASPSSPEIVEILEPSKCKKAESKEINETTKATKANNTNRKAKKKRKQGSEALIRLNKNIFEHHDNDDDDDNSPGFRRTLRSSTRSMKNDNFKKVNYCEEDEDNDNQSDNGSVCTITSSSSESDFESGVTSDEEFVAETTPNAHSSSLKNSPRKSVYVSDASDFEDSEESESESETETETPLTFLEWLRKQRKKENKNTRRGYRNKIILHPDPLSVADFELEKNPLRCGLCGVKLGRREEEVKNHAENCWLHNKHKHVHCLTCNKHFRYPAKLMSHIFRRHCDNSEPNLGEQSDGEVDENWINIEDDDDIIEDSLPLFKWIQNRREKYTDIILLDKEPQPMQLQQVSQVSASNPLKCLLCTKSLASDSEVKIHVKTCWAYNKDSHRYCLFCKILFDDVRGLETHRRSIHAKDNLPSGSSIHCLECNNGFYTLEDFRKHEDSAQIFYQTMRGVEEPRNVKRWSSALYFAPIPIKPKPAEGEEKETEEQYLRRLDRENQIKIQNRIQAQAERKEMQLSLAEYLLLHKQSQREENDQERNPTDDLIDDENINTSENRNRSQNQFQQNADYENSKNIILLDPDPLASASTSTSPSLDFEISSENPVTCRMCQFKLESETELRNHVENCWLHNKPRHLHCLLCSKTFPYKGCFLSHKKKKHVKQYPDEESPLEKLPLNQWLQREMKNPENLILLEPEPIFGRGAQEDKDDDIRFPIKCLLCQLSLTSEVLLRNHVQTCFRFNKTKHCYCIPCKRAFNFRYTLLTHNKNYHESTTSMKCKVCEREFQSEEAFLHHQESLNVFKESVRRAKRAKVNAEKWDKSKDTNAIGSSVENINNTFDALFHWLVTERQIKNLDGSENIILLDPEPREGQMEEISSKNPIQCRLCSKKLISGQSVRSHAEFCWIRNKKKHLFCLPCSKSFDTSKLLQEHQRSAHNQAEKEQQGQGQPSLLCQLCHKSLPNENLYKVHLEMHKDPNFKPLQCPQCPPENPRFFRTKNFLLKHLVVHGRVTKYKCGFCSKFFESKVRLRDHERTHTGEKPFKCQVSNCTMTFKTKPQLTVHQKKRHNTELGLEQFLCQECGMIFGIKGDLEKHMRIRHTEDRPFKCTFKDGDDGAECSKAFKVKHQLTQHMREHTGETPFQCSVCGKAFSQKWSFVKHQRSHEGTLNRASCHLCPRKFLGGWELKMHLKKDHDPEEEDGGDLDNLGQGTRSKFKCQYCGVGCGTKKYLSMHEKSHEEEDEEDSESESD